MERVFLSIDLDYYNGNLFVMLRQMDRLAKHSECPVGKWLVVEYHHHILPALEIATYSTLLNVDYHSDFVEEYEGDDQVQDYRRRSDESNWSKFVPGRTGSECSE